MAGVTLNAKGTSLPSFKVGKNGTVINSDGSVDTPVATDFVINIDEDQFVVIDAGLTGPALITSSDMQDLHINPAVGGGQYLVLCENRWPVADGTAGQTLVTNGSGVLSFSTPTKIGTAAPATTATTGFAYIPVTTGTPTGTPDTVSGFVPMLADSGNNRLWIYINGAWKYASLT